MLPVVDIAVIAEEIRRRSEDLVAAFEDQEGAVDTDPRILLDALEKLFDGLRLLEREQAEEALGGASARFGWKDVNVLGAHGIELLSRLAILAGRLRHPHLALDIEGLALPLACWIARHGGEIANIAPVVNGAAGLANRLKEPAQLERLYGLLSEIVNGVSPRISQDTGSADPTRPWRILLINRAIVATRSHQPGLMEEAFAAIVECLPEDAPDFFRGAMEQMEALDYPPQVRVVVHRFYDQWCSQRTLH